MTNLANRRVSHDWKNLIENSQLLPDFLVVSLLQPVVPLLLSSDDLVVVGVFRENDRTGDDLIVLNTKTQILSRICLRSALVRMISNLPASLSGIIPNFYQKGSVILEYHPSISLRPVLWIDIRNGDVMDQSHIVSGPWSLFPNVTIQELTYQKFLVNDSRRNSLYAHSILLQRDLFERELCWSLWESVLGVSMWSHSTGIYRFKAFDLR